MTRAKLTSYTLAVAALAVSGRRMRRHLERNLPRAADRLCALRDVAELRSRRRATARPAHGGAAHRISQHEGAPGRDALSGGKRIIAGQIKTAADMASWDLFAMVKRGGGFNEGGALDWEFFILGLDESGTPMIRARGANPERLGRRRRHQLWRPDDDGRRHLQPVPRRARYRSDRS